MLRTKTRCARLTFGMISRRFRPRKWNSLPWGSLSLRSLLPSDLTTRSPLRKDQSTQTHKWAPVSSTLLRFRSTNKLFSSQPPLMFANSLPVRLSTPPIYISTTTVPGSTPVQIRTPLQTPVSAGIAAARNAGLLSKVYSSCVLFVAVPPLLCVIYNFCIRVVCCW